MIGIRKSKQIEGNIYKIGAVIYKTGDLSGSVKESLIMVESIPDKPENGDYFKVIDIEKKEVFWEKKKQRETDIEEIDEFERSNFLTEENSDINGLEEEINDLWEIILEGEGII